MSDLEERGNNHRNSNNRILIPMLDGAASSSEIIIPKCENEKKTINHPNQRCG